MHTVIQSLLRWLSTIKLWRCWRIGTGIYDALVEKYCLYWVCTEQRYEAFMMCKSWDFPISSRDMEFLKLHFFPISSETELEKFQKVPSGETFLKKSCIYSYSMHCCHVNQSQKHDKHFHFKTSGEHLSCTYLYYIYLSISYKYMLAFLINTCL